MTQAGKANLINKLEVYDIDKITSAEPTTRNVMGKNFFFERGIHSLSNICKQAYTSRFDPILQLYKGTPLKACKDLKLKLY